MVEIFMILGKFATLEINSKIYHANKIIYICGHLTNILVDIAFLGEKLS